MIYLTLLAGLLLSGTAGYYSVIGLLAIFPGSLIPIVTMGSTLEFAKLVSVSWLYRNWERAPVLMKSYFIFAILILMFITSLGTFGFLSKVHLQSATSVQEISIQVKRIEDQIEFEKIKYANAQKSLDAMNKLVDATTDPDKAIIVRNRQKNERASIEQTIKTCADKIANLNTELSPYKEKINQAESEIGPLKYVAEMIYGEEATDHFDSAVRFVIILIVLVFDPLAILLLIAANMSMGSKKIPKKKVANSGKIVYNNGIPVDSVYKFKTNDDFGINPVDKIK